MRCHPLIGTIFLLHHTHMLLKVSGINNFPLIIIICSELKRRLSSSSVENDDDEDYYGDQDKVDEEQIRKNVQALDAYDKQSSIAHVLKQNLEETHKKQRLPLHWDPRNASRTPSAKKMPHLRFRYDTPINACMLFGMIKDLIVVFSTIASSQPTKTMGAMARRPRSGRNNRHLALLPSARLWNDGESSSNVA